MADTQSFWCAEPERPFSVPTRGAAAWYWLRVWRHVATRAVRDRVGQAIRRHAASSAYVDAPVLAEVASPLWPDAEADEFVLIAGKVHNLRIAVRAFEGIFVPQGEVLSFWKQVGRPSVSKGFVEGREIREGCVVPTVAGGLCQLSNALASAANAAGLELVERWSHTARPIGDAPTATEAMDATVFWNYVDLRIAATYPFRIDVDMDSTHLRVRIRGERSTKANVKVTPGRGHGTVFLRPAEHPRATARGCLTCDETTCFRHRTRLQPIQQRTAALLDTWTPEFDGWLAREAATADRFGPWVRRERRGAGHWGAPSTPGRPVVAVAASLYRMVALRRAAGEGGARQAALLSAHAVLARAYATRLRPHHTHLVVDQKLLLPLLDTGALGGRTFDVLMASLPSSAVQAKLDTAARRWPGAESLVDFRVNPAQERREWAALSRARRVVTAHRDVAQHLSEQGLETVELLAWVRPVSVTRRQPRPPVALPVIGFPASALARKGVNELAAAARELGWAVLVLGSPAADPDIWRGVDVRQGRYGMDWLAQVDLVVLPAHVEHAPRALLQALAHNVPVVATAACGLSGEEGLIEVTTGDVSGLIVAMRAAVGLRAHAPGPAAPPP